VALARPVIGQVRPERSTSIISGTVWNDSSTWKRDSAGARSPLWLKKAFGSAYLFGGFELGRALSNATSDSAGVVLNAASRPATTLSGNATLEVGRVNISGFGGVSLTRANRGAFGRITGLSDLIRNDDQLPLLQFGADYTAVRSPAVPGLMSTGATVRVGNPRVVQGGLRIGGRWRASTYTPVTAIDLSKTMSWWIPKNGLLSAQLSALGVFTKVPAARGLIGYVLPHRTTERASLADMTLQLQFARGDWAIGGRAVKRVGRSASVWDDPVPTQSYMRQSSDGHAAAVGRIIWAPLSNFVFTAEGGRQLSDPILGLSGVRYASVSMRMNFEAGRRRPAWFERQQINRAADAVLALSYRHDALVVKPTQESDGRRLLTLYDVKANRVEVAGDFTQWKPVELQRCQENNPDKWCGYFHLPSGVYHLIYRKDGGEWEIPSGLTPVDDSFGGRVGLLIIP
jgi:hypothetical protein